MATKTSPVKSETFAIFPREFASQPGKYGLSIIETALMAGILRAAFRRDYEQRDKIAFREGRRALVAHRQKGGKYDQRGKQIARFARHKSMEEQKRRFRPAEIIDIKLTGTDLLRLAGISPDTRHLQALDIVLRKLMKRSVPNRPPLLRTYRLFLDGKIGLFVSGDWLEPPYVKVALPLPTRSKNAINLGLFLRCIILGGHIKLSNLAHDVLGLRTRKGYEQRRFVERALRVLNAALWASNKKIPTTAAKYSFRSNDLPLLYAMKIERDRVYFGQARKPYPWQAEA
jgi:hypothetical protein